MLQGRDSLDFISPNKATNSDTNSITTHQQLMVILFGQFIKNDIEIKLFKIISGDPPCKDGNARFTTVPLKALSDQVWTFLKLFILICGFSAKVTCTLFAYIRKTAEKSSW